MRIWKILTVFCLLTFAGTLKAGVLNVPAEYPDLKTALSFARHCDSISVDSGTFSGPGFRELYFTDTTCVLIISKHGPSSTVIDLEGSYFCDGANWAGNPPYWVVISGFHFINGNPAIRYCYGCELALVGCVVSECAIGVEAGMYAGGYYGGVFRCEFRNNNIAIRGQYEAWLTVGNCLIQNNTNGIVGDILPAFYIYNCTFVKNSAAGYRVNESSMSQLENNVFAYNMFGIYASAVDSGYWMNRLLCNDIFGNWWEDYSGLPNQTGINGNISIDPRYCDTSFHELTVASISPLVATNNNCKQLIGHEAVVTCYCGDVDVSGNVDISDITALVNYMYISGPAPVPLEAGEIDQSPPIDIADLTRLVDYLYISFQRLPCGT